MKSVSKLIGGNRWEAFMTPSFAAQGNRPSAHKSESTSRERYFSLCPLFISFVLIKDDNGEKGLETPERVCRGGNDRDVTK